MDSSSGRTLTSSRGGPSETASSTLCDPSTSDDGRFIPNALDFAYRAFLAENAVSLSIPPVYCNAQAVDSASFAGRGVSFAVYRRRIPPQKRLTSLTDLGGWSIEVEDKRRLPDVVAYKVPVIEFSDKGEATHTSRHAINAAIMELSLSAHRPILVHPNLVDFLGLAWGTNPFNHKQMLPVIIVEFAECGSLSQLQQREYLSIQTRRKLCLDICQGLHMLHSCGVVHGDIKADNVLVFPDETHKYKAKLSDFGYSLVLDAQQNNLLLGGTRPWKAPEAKTAVQVSEAKYTDIYSLALLMWTTFAHGRNIFKLLADPSKHGEEFYSEAERMKETGELAEQTGLSAWYWKGIMCSPYSGSLPSSEQLLQYQQQLQRIHAQTEGTAGIIDSMERFLCTIPVTYAPVFEPMKQLFISSVQRSGLYSGMQRAVVIGLSNEPTRRDLDQIMTSLGYDGSFTQESAGPDQVLKSNIMQHEFQWHHWTKMDPSFQRYITTTYIQRGEENIKEGMVNPPEAFLLTSLYINGYGVDKDRSSASKWLFHAWNVNHPLSAAYGYRIARAIGIKFDNTEPVVSSLRSMALRGSRTALQDLAIVSNDVYQDTREIIRKGMSGTGANHFSTEELLHGFQYGMWIKTFENIPVLLENFSRLQNIADYTINKRGDRILHMAASCGQTEAIETLINRFPSLTIDQINDQGETPLLCACRAGQTRTVLWLTSHGAKASIVPDRLPEGYAIRWATHCDRPQIVKLLLSNMADSRICNVKWYHANSALRIGASQLRSECLELMMHAIEQYHVEQGVGKSYGFLVSELLEQAVHGSSLFDMILYHGPHYQQAMESTFNCLLSRASRVAHGAYGGFKQTLLYFAVSLARDELVEYLLKHGADAIKAGIDDDEEVSESRDVGAFKTTDINRPCGVDMRTPLLEAVRWNRPTMVNLLLDHGAQATETSKNPFSGQDSTWTALHILAYAGQDATRLVPQLLEHGAAIDGLSDHFRTTESPLLIAVQNDSFRLADSLISNGADVNFTTLSCGHLTLSNPTTILGHVVAANARNSIARLRHLLDNASIRGDLHFIVEPVRQWTALHRAAAAHIDVEFRGTDVTEAAGLNWADVDWGANREILNELLGHFNDLEQLNAVDQTGQTPMHLAVLAGNEAAVKLLLDHGARHDLPNLGGQGPTAADIALAVQMVGLSVIGETGRPGREEVAARKQCSDYLNPTTQSSAQAQPALT